MKKILIGLASGLLGLIGFCVAYVFVYFQKIDGVSAGAPIGQGLPDKPALLVIDIQEGITGKSAPVFNKTMARQSGPFIEKVNRTITLAHGKHLPVIYIRQESSDRLFNSMTMHLLAKGDPSAALDQRVKVVAGPVFTKDKMDAFSNPELETFLRSRGINHLYVTGLSATTCVDRTIKAALNRGYAVTAITDAIIGEKVKDKEAAYLEWSKAAVTLMAADQFK